MNRVLCQSVRRDDTASRARAKPGAPEALRFIAVGRPSGMDLARRAGMRRRLTESSALTSWGVGALIAGGLLLTAPSGHAAELPTGGAVVAGSGSISQSGQTMDIVQDTDRMAIDWQGFSIGAGSTVNFHQPSASSVALNRVLGSDVSVIQGALNANGQVFLVNPNGVLFSPTAEVNVGGIVASTLDIATEDFLAGNYTFEGDSPNAVINRGNIAAPGGVVGLIGARIVNDGTIAAEGGAVLMGAGSRVRLDLGGPVQIEVEQAALDALIEQGGGIVADGGLVYLTARAAGNLAATVINHTGITQARTLETGENGEIYLMGGMERERIQVGGTLDASAPAGGDGGFIETSAAVVNFSQDLSVTTRATDGETGTWLIDPTDVRILRALPPIGRTESEQFDIDGINYVASEDYTTVYTQLLESVLEDSHVIIETPAAGDGDGTITILDDFSWSWNTLTLRAHHDILIRAVLSAEGSAGLVLETGANGLVRVGLASGIDSGFAGRVDMAEGTTLTVNNQAYALIREAAELRNMTSDGHYALAADIALDEGFFDPIASFTGIFNGLGHTISNLKIESSNNNLGLFGQVSTDSTVAQVGNVGLIDVDINGTGQARNVGALVGNLSEALVFNSFSSGTVQGYEQVGGLIGLSSTGDVSYAYSTADVSGVYEVGGLIGTMEGGSVRNSYSAGDVTGAEYRIGGLIGRMRFNSSVSQSFSTGNVEGDLDVGGLVGNVDNSSLIHTFSTGNVVGRDGVVGGLVGYYERGTHGTGSITYSFSTGEVSGGGDVGGLVGAWDTGSAQVDATSILWDVTSSLQEGTGGNRGTGKTTAEMHEIDTYRIDREWGDIIYGASGIDKGYPVLAWTLPGAYDATWIIGTRAVTPPAPTPDNGSGTSDGGSSSERPDVDSFAVQQAAATIVPPTLSFTLPQATAATPDPNVTTLGGLRYVNTPAPAAQGPGEGGQEAAPAGAAPTSTGGGRDAAGFMNVFVVGGGINTAATAGASPTAPSAEEDGGEG